MFNGTPSTRIPHGWPQPMTTNRRGRRLINYIRNCYMIPFPKHYSYIIRNSPNTTNNISMMTRYRTRRDIPRTPYAPRTKRPTLWDNPIYYLRSIFLPRLFLSILPLKLSPNTRTRRMLTTYRNYHPRPIRGATTKHSRPPSLRRYSHLSPP